MDFRFDPEVDLDVSGRHAVVGRDAGGSWVVRDLGSTNGTFVNGRRIEGETALRPSDRIAFGEHGPVVEFRVSGFTGGGEGGGSPATARTRALGHRPERTAGPRRLALAGAIAGLVVATAAGLYTALARSVAWEGERAALQQRIDSLTVAGQASVASLEEQLRELSTALAEARDEVATATARLREAQARGDPAELAALRARLDAATTALGQREAAANLDFTAIQRANRPAIAIIYVEDATGRVSTGTAFAVRPDATLVTSRHVVVGERGDRPNRIAVQFSDSDQVWPARILAVAEERDLAVVKVDNIVGDVPTVRSFNLRPDTVASGNVVASIGYPVGRGLTPGASYERGGIVRPLVSAGIVGSVSDEVIEVQGYGSAGASGSPVFDSKGAVLAVLFGGVRDTAHPVLLAVPATAVVELLSTLP